MTSVEQTASPIPPPAGGEAADGVDPELLGLPAPPQGRRLLTLTLMALVVVGSMAMVFSLRHELVFFFGSDEITDLGDVSALDRSRLIPNRYVHVQGVPMLSRTARYERVLTRSSYLVFPLAGQRTVYVQVPDAPDALAQSEFTGRLVTFGQLGSQLGPVTSRLRAMGQPVSAQSFVLLADESPQTYLWALLLTLLGALFIAIDVFLFIRWFKPLTAPARLATDEQAASA